MHPHGNLGPVDPQVTSKRMSKQGNEPPTDVKFGYEEVLSFIHFVRERAHITDQKELASILRKLLEDIGTLSVGYAVRGSMLSQSLGENLLRMHMTGDGEAIKAKDIADALNKKFLHHGYAVGRNEAKDIGLKVTEIDKSLEKLMWAIWEDVETELKMRQQYNPMAELASSQHTASLFAPTNSISLPQGLPPQMTQAILQQVAGQLQVTINPVPPIDTEVVHGVMESSRICSRYVIRRKLFGSRQQDGTIGIAIVDISAGWEPVPITRTPESAKKGSLQKRDAEATILSNDGEAAVPREATELKVTAAERAKARRPASTRRTTRNRSVK
jgi:hypothetical protein